MKFTIKTKGRYDFINITSKVAKIIKKSNIKNGLALVFVPGSTAAITTIEYESGVINDLIKVFENLAPEKSDYEHHQKWGDRNGAAHIKSALVGTSFTSPIEDGQLRLGVWQQIVLIDFDERPRVREIIVKITNSKI